MVWVDGEHLAVNVPRFADGIFLHQRFRIQDEYINIRIPFLDHFLKDDITSGEIAFSKVNPSQTWLSPRVTARFKNGGILGFGFFEPVQRQEIFGEKHSQWNIVGRMPQRLPDTLDGVFVHVSSVDTYLPKIDTTTPAAQNKKKWEKLARA